MKIDFHSHVDGKDGKLDEVFCDQLIEADDKLGIDKMCCCKHIILY